MASKRNVIRRLCRRKVRHGTRNGAVRVAMKMSRADKELDAYACKYCGGWHVGHDPAARTGLRRKLWFIAEMHCA